MHSTISSWKEATNWNLDAFFPTRWSRFHTEVMVGFVKLISQRHGQLTINTNEMCIPVPVSLRWDFTGGEEDGETPPAPLTAPLRWCVNPLLTGSAPHTPHTGCKTNTRLKSELASSSPWHTGTLAIFIFKIKLLSRHKQPRYDSCQPGPVRSGTYHQILFTLICGEQVNKVWRNNRKSLQSVNILNLLYFISYFHISFFSINLIYQHDCV